MVVVSKTLCKRLLSKAKKLVNPLFSVYGLSYSLAINHHYFERKREKLVNHLKMNGRGNK